MATPEGGAQAAILDYLRLRGHLCFRLNNIPATYVDQHGERQFRALSKYGIKGLPDIMLIRKPTGRLFGIEVKAPGKKPSPEQLDFGRRLIEAGGEYVVAREIEDVIKLGL